MLYVFLFVLGRIMLGGYFIMSGWNHFAHLEANTGYARSKGVPMPRESVILTGIMLLLGGLGILLGMYMSCAIFLLVLFLLATLWKMHRYWEVTDPMARMGEHINFWKNVALIGALLMLLAIPPSLMIPAPWIWYSLQAPI